MKNIKVIVTRKLPSFVETSLSNEFDVTLNRNDEPMTKEQLIEAVISSDVLVPAVSDLITREIIKNLDVRIKLIANFGVGVNHIDLEAVHEEGITVTNTPDVLTEDTADLAMTLILMASRRVGEGERMVRSGNWSGWAPTQLMGHRVSGKHLGIIGMGRIGGALAERAAGFGMSISYHNRTKKRQISGGKPEIKYWNDLDAMLKAVDVVSVNAPYTSETKNMLNSRRLNMLKDNCILINTARGGLVDETALIRRLQAGKIAAAGLDVYDQEPVIKKELIELENVVLLPHLGSATIESRVAMGMRVLENIRNFFKGNTNLDRVV